MTAASTVGKRLNKDDPLGPHDIADRLDRATLRVWRILLLTDDAGPEFRQAVRGSRYLTNAISECRDAISRFLADKSEGSLAALDPAEKVRMIEAMGFTPMGSSHQPDCPYALDAGLVCICVPPATVWNAPDDVLKHRGELGVLRG